MVASGRPVGEIAQALGIGENLIYRWKNGLKKGTGTAKNDGVQDQNLFLENERLRAELRRTEQERDILKKALGILGREK